MSPWTLVGIGTSCISSLCHRSSSSSPSSRSIRTVSSRKSGLPPALVISVSANGVSANAASPVRPLSSAAACSGPSVCRSTVRRRPSLPRKPGAESSISGRVVAMTASGTPTASSARRYASSSSSVGSAQCRSSTTTAVGLSAARSCRVRRIPQCSSACEISLVTYVPRGVVGDTDQVGERGRDRPELVEVIGGERLEEGVELLRARLAVVALQDPRRRLEDLHDRPVRDALAVREALSAVDGELLLESSHELEQQAALADAGRADDRRQTRRTLLQQLVAERR